MGGAAIDATGEPLPAATLAAAQAADAVFLGAVGGPRWTSGPRPEAGLLALREALGLFANLRPVAIDEALIDRSPLKIEAVRDLDLLIVRELTSGLYFGERTPHRHERVRFVHLHGRGDRAGGARRLPRGARSDKSRNPRSTRPMSWRRAAYGERQ